MPTRDPVPAVRNLFADLPTLAGGEFCEELVAFLGTHRVLRTSPEPPCLWPAVHIHPE